MPAAPSSDVWPTNAHHWHLLGSPLRPSPEDVLAVARVAADHARALGRPIRAVLLGVTPELATLDWPEGTSLVAIDKSAAMIQSVWPSWGLPRRAAVKCADWRAMPIDDASVDMVVGDGVYSALVHGDYAALTAQIRRILCPAGLFVMRAFVAPSEREALRVVGDDLWSGRIGSFHAFKWRLAMALQPSLDEGVCVGDVWRVWSDLCPNRDALATKLGWDLATVASIDAYRDVTTRYTFPTLDELRAELAPAFEERACHAAPYELGERCPTIVLQARSPGNVGSRGRTR